MHRPPRSHSRISVSTTLSSTWRPPPVVVLRRSPKTADAHRCGSLRHALAGVHTVCVMSWNVEGDAAALNAFPPCFFGASRRICLTRVAGPVMVIERGRPRAPAQHLATKKAATQRRRIQKATRQANPFMHDTRAHTPDRVRPKGVEHCQPKPRTASLGLDRTVCVVSWNMVHGGTRCQDRHPIVLYACCFSSCFPPPLLSNSAFNCNLLSSCLSMFHDTIRTVCVLHYRFDGWWAWMRFQAADGGGWTDSFDGVDNQSNRGQMKAGRGELISMWMTQEAVALVVSIFWLVFVHVSHREFVASNPSAREWRPARGVHAPRRGQWLARRGAATFGMPAAGCFKGAILQRMELRVGLFAI